jgi:hypothetical protein
MTSQEIDEIEVHPRDKIHEGIPQIHMHYIRRHADISESHETDHNDQILRPFISDTLYHLPIVQGYSLCHRREDGRIERAANETQKGIDGKDDVIVSHLT